MFVLYPYWYAAASPPAEEGDYQIAFHSHFNGLNSENTTFVEDVGDYGLTNTMYGNCRCSASGYKFGTSSLYSDGSGDACAISYHAKMAVGTADFTLEFWVYPSSVGGGLGTIATQRATSSVYAPYLIQKESGTGVTKLYMSTDGSTYSINGTTIGTLSASTWHHIALVRSGTNIYVYLDGTRVINTTLSGSLANDSGPLMFLGDTDGNSLNGFLDEARLTYGLARYTGASFTVATAPFAGTDSWVPTYVSSSTTDTWLNERSDVTIDSGKITLWTNRSAAYNFTAASTGTAPTYNEAGANASRTLTFDGTDDVIYSTDADALSMSNGVACVWSALVVRKTSLDSTTTSRTIYYNAVNGATGSRHSVNVGNATATTSTDQFQLRGRRNDADSISTVKRTTAVDTNFHVLIAVQYQTLADATLYYDGSPAAYEPAFGNAGSIQATNSTRAVSIGAVNADTTPAEWANIELAEVVVGAGSRLDAHDVQLLSSYLAHKWGLASNLPAGRWKTYPPYIDDWHYDAYGEYVTMLLHFDGADASTTITDDSRNRYPISAAGNAQLDEGRKKFGASSLLLDGTGDYLTVGNPSNVSGGLFDYIHDGSTFTVDLWVYSSAAFGGSNRPIIHNGGMSSANVGFALYVNTSGYPCLNIAAGGSFAAQITGSTVMTANAWHHIAIVRTGGTYYLLMDGASIGSTAGSGMSSAAATSTLYIGGDTVNATYWQGWIDELRISDGYGRWSGAYTVPASPALITAPTYSDSLSSSVAFSIPGGGTNGSTLILDEGPDGMPVITYGTVQHDTSKTRWNTAVIAIGATSGMMIPYRADTVLGASDWCFEADLYFTSITNSQTIFSTRTANGQSHGFHFRLLASTGALDVFASDAMSGGWDIQYQAGELGYLSAGQWYHVALCRQGTVLMLFVNGRMTHALPFDLTIIDTGDPYKIGADALGLNPIDGYVSNVRLTIGNTRYNASFQPPQWDLPATTYAYDAKYASCVLRLTMDGSDASTTYYDHSPSGRTVTAVGTAQVDTAQSKFGGASSLFDGNSDYLTVSGGASDFNGLHNGASDFTIEAWIRANGSWTDGGIIDTGGFTSTNVGATLFVTSGGIPTFYQSTGSGYAVQLAGPTALSVDTWYHVAVSSQASTDLTSLYVDGVLVASKRGASHSASDATYGLRVGMYQSAGYFNGWIDDVRVTIGARRYLAGARFAVPTAAYPVAGWTPAELASSTLKMWLNEKSDVTDSSGYATAWYDHGNDRVTMSSVTAGTYPLINASGLNSMRTLTFDGTNDRLSNSGTAAKALTRNVSKAWVFAVVKKTALDGAATDRSIFFASNGTASSSARFYLNVGSATATTSTNTPQIRARRLDADAVQSVERAGGAVDTNFHMILATMDYTATTGTIYYDGATDGQNTSMLTTGSTSNTASSSGLVIAAINTSSFAAHANIEVAEMIIGSGTLPDSTEIDKLFGYAAHKWGLTSLLSGGHTYKNRAP